MSDNAVDVEKSHRLSTTSDAPEKKKTIRQRVVKIIKILLPHVGLTAILLSYICFGAICLQTLESETELKRRQHKLQNISRIYTEIINNTWIQCEHRIGYRHSMEFMEWTEFIQTQLVQLSQVHELDVRQPIEEEGFNLDVSALRSRWTFQASVLYALTVLTTTAGSFYLGYDHVSPLTDGGKLLSVCFGLLGIPLMFITAADIGKFLSDIFLRLYASYIRLKRYVYKKLCQRCRKKQLVNGRLKYLEGDPKPVERRQSVGDEAETASRRRSSAFNHEDDDEEEPEDLLDEENQPGLPVFAYFGLILGYCSLGGLLYTRWETGPIWSFLHAFHFSFNCITTISLGNILVRDPVYLCFIVCYIIIGLAVVTMCVDLASSQLKVLFTKLHYFGRKMRGARSAFANMSDDLKEAMRIIATIRKAKEGRAGSITVEDIKQYLEIRHKYLMTKPYIPTNIRYIEFVDQEERESRISGSGMSLNIPPEFAVNIEYF